VFTAAGVDAAPPLGLPPADRAAVLGTWEHHLWLRLSAVVRSPPLPPPLAPLRLRLEDGRGKVLAAAPSAAAAAALLALMTAGAATGGVCGHGGGVGDTPPATRAVAAGRAEGLVWDHVRGWAAARPADAAARAAALPDAADASAVLGVIVFAGAGEAGCARG